VSDTLTGVTCTVEEHVGTLTFTNPRQHGALTPELLRELRRQLRVLEAKRPQVRVVVLRGGGDIFSSGYALDRFPEPDELGLQDEIEELCQAIERSPLPVIALLRGLAVGAALDVAASCDFRFAERTCRLGITPAKLGIVYTVQGSARIHRLVGPDWARRLFFTGDLVQAEEASRFGLVTAALDSPEDAEREAYALATRIAGRAPLSVAGSKRIMASIESSRGLPFAQVAELHELRRAALRSPDCAEARAAFAEKRNPVFTGEE
jgi:enoyl-CoA hydratase/carnithine racemase